MHELILAQDPTRYLGGSMETWALPTGVFIVIGQAAADDPAAPSAAHDPEGDA